MSRAIVIGLRVLQVLFALANLALSGYVIHWFMLAARVASPSPFNFLIFASIFSLFSVVYLEAVPRYAPRLAHPYPSLALELTNTVFYFAGFIALTVFLSQLVFCNGPVCASGRAAAIVAAGQFTAWIASTIFMAKELFKAGLRKPLGEERQMREV